MSESETDPLETDGPEISPWSAPIADREIATPEALVSPPRPWGPWATIGWTLLCIVVFFGAQIIAAILFVLFRSIKSGNLKVDDLGTNGNLLAFATLLSTPATVGLVALFIWLRGCPIRDYLALYWPPAQSVGVALLGLAVVLGATDLSSYLLGRPLVPPVMVDFYRTAWLPAILFAFVVLAPVGEETLFRGFLYKGIAASRMGPVTAIIFSSVAFAVMHLQYDLYGILAVAAIGLYLGLVRFRSHSLLLTMLLHALGNAFATLELFIQETWMK